MHLYLADGQSDSIVTDIENMVRSYIEKVKMSDLVENLDDVSCGCSWMVAKSNSTSCNYLS
jgi:hypothetical protein